MVKKERHGLEEMIKVFAGVCMFTTALVLGFIQDVIDRCQKILK